MLTLRIPWTNQTLDKHVGDSTDSDNEEKEDGELEEGEVEEEFDEIPQQKDDAKENNRDNNNTNDTSIEQDNSVDLNNQLNMGSQKFRRRDYHQHHHHLGPPRLNSSAGQQDKRNKHEQRRKRRHSGEERDERNRKPYKRGRFRGGPGPDLGEDGEDDEMMGPTWPPRGQNRGQRKQQSDMLSNENSESAESGDQQSLLNPITESKSEQSINSDETASPNNDIIDDENMNADEKQDRPTRPRMTRNNQQPNSMTIENRGRRYYDGNTNNNNNMNNRRLNDRDRSSWQDRTSNNNNGNNSNSNSNNNQRYRSDAGSSTNHGPPLCKFFVENRCMKGNDCLFSHDYKPQKKMEVCKYYVQNKGYCQKNDACSYLHGEFPCKFFHTGTKDCKQGERCKFSHDPIVDEDIRAAFERFLNDSDEMNRQNRGNSNNNIHYTNNSSSVNYDVIGASSLPPPPPIPSSLSDPSNFSMIPNLMDLFLLRNGRLSAAATTNDQTNTDITTTTANTSQSSPPVQRPSLFNDTLSTDKTDNEDSTNKTVSSTNSTSPSSSIQNTTSTNDSTSTTTVTSTNTTPTVATTNSTCPLPLPPSNTNLNLSSAFGRLPPPNLNRPPSSLLPPPPPGLFSMSNLGTGRVPILFPTNNGLPLPPPPGSLIDMKLLAQAAALAAVNAAVAKNFPTPPHHHHSQSSSPQLGRDIDERDRQSSTTMRGDIDERPSDVYNRPTANLGLLQTTTAIPTTNLNSPSSSSSPTMTINDEHLKIKTVQDIFRTARPTSVDTLSNPISTNSTVGPSFDFISMLEQLKQPRQTPINDNSHDSLEIRSSSSQPSVYIVRPVLVSFKPYLLPDKATDPRITKYQEKMAQWSEQARLERFKTPILPSNNYSVPFRPQQQTSINDTNSSRDPRLLRNSAPSSKLGVPILSTPSPFVRPNDNIL